MLSAPISIPQLTPNFNFNLILVVSRLTAFLHRSHTQAVATVKMKISGISAAFALAASLVNAAPIRVVLISTGQRVAPVNTTPAWAQAIRWGHAAAPAFNSLPPPGQPARFFVPDNSVKPHWMPVNLNSGPNTMLRKGGCRGGMRSKAVQMGNRLRIILGLPPIEPHPHRMQSFPITESTYQPTRYRHYHAHHHMNKEPFMFRLSRALAELGPWEGRVVSFVLGCGLGAILRMFFVFGVLIVRSIRCQRQRQPVALEEDTVIFVADIKEPVEAEALPAYAEKTNEAPQGENAAN